MTNGFGVSATISNIQSILTGGFASGTEVNVRDADFIGGVAGSAYRPVPNERLNALAWFTYFQGLAPIGQLSGTGTTQNPKQISRMICFMSRPLRLVRRSTNAIV
jgi:hypothetical protein